MHDIAAGISAPHVNFSETTWVLIGIIVLGLYLNRRAGAGIFTIVAPFALGALSAGLWPSLSGKLAAWGAGGAADRTTVYIVVAISVLGTMFLTERSLRGGGGG